MKKRINLVLGLFVFSMFMIGSASALMQAPVTFNGAFQNGTTLYSNSVHIDFGQIWGRDVYPDKAGLNQRMKVCEIVNKTKTQKVCTPNTTGYINRTVQRCSTRGVQYPTVCENVTIQQKTNARQSCENVKIQVPTEVCKTVTVNASKIACRNPNGEYTNSLRLENFKMSFDSGSSWQAIPYIEQRQTVNNVDVEFKVDIPAECSPVYRINEAVWTLH